jgi:hypothetical protein
LQSKAGNSFSILFQFFFFSYSTFHQKEAVMAAKKQSQANDHVIINAPNMHIMKVPIRGTTNFVSNNFGEEARQQMEDDQRRGSVDKPAAGGRSAKKPPKDFEKGFRESLHKSTEGWYGIPVIAFRSAMVRAAQLCGIEMTRAKMCVFVECDGFDKEGKGLVRITKGEPEQFIAPVRNAGGKPDLRARGRFAPGWEAIVTMRFDADFLSKQSAINLLARAGAQVGVGAGRPFSTMSVGQGWGEFQIIVSEEEEKAAE